MNHSYAMRYALYDSLVCQTHTPCGFLLVGTAFSSCLGDPIILRVLPGLWGPETKYSLDTGRAISCEIKIGIYKLPHTQFSNNNHHANRCDSLTQRVVFYLMCVSATLTEYKVPYLGRMWILQAAGDTKQKMVTVCQHLENSHNLKHKKKKPHLQGGASPHRLVQLPGSLGLPPSSLPPAALPVASCLR